MSAVEVTKQESLARHPDVRPVLEIIQGEPDGLAVLEITLLELALAGLHQQRDGIKRVANQTKKQKKTETKKFYRAVAKMGLGGDEQTREMLEQLLSKHLGGEDGDEDHPSGSSQDVHSGGSGDSSDKTRDKNLREEQRRRESTTTPPESIEGQIARGDRITPKNSEIANYALSSAFDFIDDERTQGAVKSYLNESTIGSGVVAVADFFSRTGGKLQFAARAIRDFGPIAGVRLAHSYFRYGGYNIPMQEKDGRVVTEMGDTLPEPKSAKETRKWAIEALKKRLPGENADRANAEPPSEGFIIDKNGNVLAHGVGRGNDHFLPFNSRHLKAMRQSGSGVEYVRRRMFGGPTVEDLHAAMMMGADRVTVVSNAGQFTINLKERSHGIKMEHMQILDRFQEILDDRSENLTFSAYNSALDSLEAEFPLHFRNEHPEKGRWADRHDRIGPRAKFRDQIANLFDSLAGDDRSGSSRSGNDVISQGKINGQRNNENVWDAYRRQVNESNRESFLSQLEAAIRARGGDPGQLDTIKREREKVRRAKQRRSQSGFQRSGSSGRTFGGGSTREPSPVTTRRADPTEQRARAIQPPTGGPSFNPKGRNRMEDLGLDPSGYRSNNSEHARKLAETASRLRDEQWEEALDDPDFLADLSNTFSEITGI